ncbi:hypothetical protein CW362_10830 [Streptomyces populi]|uniref:Uncharacterized protein n=1 Tax=Streptomyces populi TaxID=2058924 RepID=A0A2I0SSX5_9ACTN|nr:hypothetical protein CW362_10830 [Streptomyces populi]
MADDWDLMDRVDAVVLGMGYIGESRAAEVAQTVPESRARILDWLRVARDSQDRHREVSPLARRVSGRPRCAGRRRKNWASTTPRCPAVRSRRRRGEAGWGELGGQVGLGKR